MLHLTSLDRTMIICRCALDPRPHTLHLRPMRKNIDPTNAHCRAFHAWQKMLEKAARYKWIMGTVLAKLGLLQIYPSALETGFCNTA